MYELAPVDCQVHRLRRVQIVNSLTKISIEKDNSVSDVGDGECFGEEGGICGLSLSYFLSEQPHESPHDDVESFRAGLNEAMRDHPRRATYASANRSTTATAMFCQSDMVN